MRTSQTKRPPKTLWACAECGCTDVRVQCWVDANTDAVLDSCDSYHWCPQCEENGDGGEQHSLVQTDTLKPYKEGA
jgi:hypothetical protein